MRGDFGFRFFFIGILDIRQSHLRIAFKIIRPAYTVINCCAFRIHLIGRLNHFKRFLQILAVGQQGIAQSIPTVRIIRIQLYHTAQIGNRLAWLIQFFIHHRTLIQHIGKQLRRSLGFQGFFGGIYQAVQSIQRFLKIGIFRQYKQSRIQQITGFKITSSLLGHFLCALHQSPSLFMVALFGFDRSGQNGFIKCISRSRYLVQPLFGFGKIFSIIVRNRTNQRRTAALLLRTGFISLFQIAVYCRNIFRLAG